MLGPKRLPYDSDEGVPAGYHVESHLKLGLLITGAILTGIGLIGVVAIEASTNSHSEVSGYNHLGAIVWGTLFMGPGLPLLIVGLASPKKELVRNGGDSEEGSLKPKRPPILVGVSTDHRGGGMLTIGKAF